MLATTTDLTTYGYTASSEALARADARVRGYLRRRASAARVLQSGAVVPAPLAELVCAIASRMSATLSQVAQGVSADTSGATTVTFGSQAYAGIADLLDSEKQALDRLYPVRPRSVHL